MDAAVAASMLVPVRVMVASFDPSDIRPDALVAMAVALSFTASAVPPARKLATGCSPAAVAAETAATSVSVMVGAGPE